MPIITGNQGPYSNVPGAYGGNAAYNVTAIQREKDYLTLLSNICSTLHQDPEADLTPTLQQAADSGQISKEKMSELQNSLTELKPKLLSADPQTRGQLLAYIQQKAKLNADHQATKLREATTIQVTSEDSFQKMATSTATFDDFARYAEDTVKHFDKDGDGRISEQELQAAYGGDAAQAHKAFQAIHQDKSEDQEKGAGITVVDEITHLIAEDGVKPLFAQRSDMENPEIIDNVNEMLSKAQQNYQAVFENPETRKLYDIADDETPTNMTFDGKITPAEINGLNALIQSDQPEYNRVANIGLKQLQTGMDIKGKYQRFQQRCDQSGSGTSKPLDIVT